MILPAPSSLATSEDPERHGGRFPAPRSLARSEDPERHGGGLRAPRSGTVALAVGAVFLARAVASSSVESLRAELWLTDQALGTLASALAGAYAAALPAGAWWARPGRRLRVLAAGLVLCAVATAASAFARGFFWLAFARTASGLGAGLGAGAVAGLALHRGREARGRGGTSGLVAAAGGIALGYLAGGLATHPLLARLFGQAPGWRGGFAVAAVAVLAAAGICARGAEPAGAAPGAWAELRGPGLRAALRRLAGDRRRALGLAAALIGAAAVSGLGFWAPAFLVRIRTVPADVAGAELAAVVFAAALAGVALAGAALRALPAERTPRWVAAAGAAIAAAAVVAALTWRAPVLALAAFLVAFAAAFAAVAGAVAVLAGRDALDPSTLALAVLLLHGAGEVAGPIALGAFADRASLGRALTAVPAALAASALLWAASAFAGAAGAGRAEEPRRHVG